MAASAQREWRTQHNSCVHQHQRIALMTFNSHEHLDPVPCVASKARQVHELVARGGAPCCRHRHLLGSCAQLRSSVPPRGVYTCTVLLVQLFSTVNTAKLHLRWAAVRAE